MQTTPKGLRLQIGIFGRRNAGKSSVLNALTRQNVAIVSDVPGTTTDPVEKPMELLPLGPVLFIDTAGIDDAGELGERRVRKTRAVLDRTDLALVVVDAGRWDEFEETILEECARRGVVSIVVLNKSDLGEPETSLLERLSHAGTPWVRTVASRGEGVEELRETLVLAVPERAMNPPPMLADLVGPGELAVLVVPIDREAPKGRLILPQVQAIRDLLDGDASAIVVQPSGLRGALARLARPPALVVTDSQAFAQVAADTPPETPLTSFSILLARQKGDLGQLVEGVRAVGRLRPGDRVLVAEACTHHPIGDDIGRVKIPGWLERHVGGRLEFTTIGGNAFPEDLEAYRLVIHCGACMLNRRAVLSRLDRCRRRGVPVTNYGMVIAYTLGLLERALGPFPEALAAFQRPGP
jgi:[FeFe] hydrogenase H-cluster maturation GTPase HydF